MRRAVLNAAVFVSMLALSLGAAELYVRHTRPGLLVAWNERVAFCQYDPEIGWINTPLARGRFFETDVVHNSHGQRDGERRQGKAVGKFRAMVVGDSFVWGYRINAADRFTDRLERALPGTAFMNFGCSGYGQDQEYLLLQRELPKYEPDLVIVTIHVGSDLENNVSTFQYGYYKPLYEVVGGELRLSHTPVPRGALGSRINAFMTPRFALWNLVMNRPFGDKNVRSRFVDVLNGMTSDASATVTSETAPVEMECRLATAMADLVTRSGAKVLFMLIPSIEPADQTIGDLSDYDAVRGCLEARSFDVLGLEPAFRRHLAKSPGAAVTLPGDRHWSAEGNEVAAEALREHIVAMGLIRP